MGGAGAALPLPGVGAPGPGARSGAACLEEVSRTRWAAPQLAALLWGVLALALLWLWGSRARRRSEETLGDPRVLRALSGEAGPRSRLLRAVLTLAAVALAVVGLMRPQAGIRLPATNSRGLGLPLSLEVSRSIDAPDVRPERLTAAYSGTPGPPL